MQPDDLLSKHYRLDKNTAQALTRLGIGTVRDLLYHFPSRYEDNAEAQYVRDATVGETVVLHGVVTGLKMKKSFRTRVPMAEGSLEDSTGRIKLVWFHQPYVAKMIPEGASVRVRGKVGKNSSGLSITNPTIEAGVASSAPLFEKQTVAEKKERYPIYPESTGVTSLWFYHAMKRVLASTVLDAFVDPIPADILERYHLPSLKSALIWMHVPENEKNAEVARKRFAFEEVFFIQVSRQKEREENTHQHAFAIDADRTRIESFTKTFPFATTYGQEKAIEEILSDFDRSYPMARLLEGDVGSGKTAVAAATAYAVCTSRPKGQNFGTLQVAYMCPTEVLATQQFESFIQNFNKYPLQIGLITGSGCRKYPSKVTPGSWTDISRAQLLKWVANGEIAVLVGTHALIQKTVTFKHLAYVIIDEQHRFGTAQRKKLAAKEKIIPHLLSMTATPIPRTLALTVYGDLDLSLLTDMPAGRKPIITDVVAPSNRTLTYEKIRKELQAGRQAYVICPRIDEPDPDKAFALNTKSVKEEAKRLKKDVFPEYEIGVMHSKMTPNEKEKVMAEFATGKIDILAATSVVEVGVNVPNATIIIIEGAERFGLAQLHQLRGRVVRSNHQAYCYLFTSSGKGDNNARLKAIVSAKNGFELAEKDLALRGAGELYGRKQWGISDVGMEALKNIRLVEAARNEAAALVKKDPELKNHPLIQKLAAQSANELHFE